MAAKPNKMTQLQIITALIFLLFIRVCVQAPVDAQAVLDFKRNIREYMLNQKYGNVPMEGSYEKPVETSSDIKKPQLSVPKEVVISESPLQKAHEAKIEKPEKTETGENDKTEQKANEQMTNNKPSQISDEKLSLKLDVEQNKDEKHKEPVKEIPTLSHEESSFVRTKVKAFSNIYSDDLDIPASYKVGSYLLVGITSVFIVIVIFKVYRMRLSRAERKYGVQGNRANQELTPLPMAIDDLGNSDDEDQTLFDRHQIRIL